MSIVQLLQNFDRIRETLPEDPIYLNDVDNITEEDRENIKNLIYTRYTSDMISILPRCSCGNTKGQFLIGITCIDCNTKVTPSITTDIYPTVWVKSPIGVKKLISPIILLMFKDLFTKSGFNIIHWLMDTSYRAPVKTPVVVRKIESLPWFKRGYNFFVENMHFILAELSEIRDFKNKKDAIEQLRILVKVCEDSVFSDAIPFPNKSLIVFEKTSLGEYTSYDHFKIVNAAFHLASIDKDFYDKRQSVIENRTAKALFLLAEYYELTLKNSMAGKPGQFRKHIFGTRTNFSFRAVITSNTDIHNYDEITIPWSVALTCFRPHLINKLIRDGYDHNQALELIMTSIESYNEYLDSLFKEIVDESTRVDTDGVTKRGIITLLQRNPSLLQGSFVRVRITDVHRDVRNKTIWMSIFLCRSLNADRL